MDEDTRKKIIKALPIENGGFALVFSPENEGDGFSMYVAENILENLDLEYTDDTKVPGMYVLFKGLTSVLPENLDMLMEKGQQAIVEEVQQMGEDVDNIVQFTPSKRLH